MRAKNKVALAVELSIRISPKVKRPISLSGVGSGVPEIVLNPSIFEPRCEKTGLRGFPPGLTQTGLCNH